MVAIDEKDDPFYESDPDEYLCEKEKKALGLKQDDIKRSESDMMSAHYKQSEKGGVVEADDKGDVKSEKNYNVISNLNLNQ